MTSGCEVAAPYIGHMHHGSINSDTKTQWIYLYMTSPKMFGEWVDFTMVTRWLLREYGQAIGAFSTYMSSIRLQLRDDFPEWGLKLEKKQEGKRWYYRITDSGGQMKLGL